MPMPEDMTRQRYQGSEGMRYHKAKRAIPEAAFHWVARLRAEKIAPHVRSSDVVLEYGVGFGWNLAALTCAHRIGFDVGEFLGTAVRKHGIEFIGEVKSQADASVDAVICHHTLEHTWHPGNVLADIRRVLKPGGRLLLFVPFEKEWRFRKFNPAEPNHHLCSWNAQTLGNLVHDAGYRVRTAGVAPFGQERFAATWAFRLGLGEGGFRVLRWTANFLKDEKEVRIVAEKSDC
ncbi:MAG: methyltransferase domain-containing protein [Verrucomicrobiia bacterium]